MKKTGKMVLFKRGEEEIMNYSPTILELMLLQKEGWEIVGEIDVIGEMPERDFFTHATITRKGGKENV